MPMVQNAWREQLKSLLTTTVPTKTVDPNTGAITDGPAATMAPNNQFLDAVSSIVSYIQINATVPAGALVTIPVTAVSPAPSAGVTTTPGTVT